MPSHQRRCFFPLFLSDFLILSVLIPPVSITGCKEASLSSQFWSNSLLPVLWHLCFQHRSTPCGFRLVKLFSFSFSRIFFSFSILWHVTCRFVVTVYSLKAGIQGFYETVFIVHQISVVIPYTYTHINNVVFVFILTFIFVYKHNYTHTKRN